jgi:vitamin B12 transporter
VNRSGTIDLALERGAEGFTAGTELAQADLESTTDGDQSRRTAGFYARGPIAAGRVTFAPAARLDIASDGAPLMGLRLAVGLDLPGRRNLRLAAGNAYRRPSFDDLFAADRGASVGDPNLLPERAREVEVELYTPLAGASSGTGSGTAEAALTATAYARRIEDLIQWTPGPDGRYRPHNVGLAVIKGLELELRLPFRVPGLARPAALEVAGTALDARNESGEPAVDGRRLPYRPAVTGHAELGLGLPLALTARGRVEATGSSYVTAANTKSLPGYVLVDVSGERAVSRHLLISVAVLNVGDIQAVDVRDYPLPGREWRLGLRLSTFPGEW